MFSPALWSFGTPARSPSTAEITGKANLCPMSLKGCHASRGGGPFVTEKEEQKGGANRENVMSCLTVRGETNRAAWLDSSV